QAFATPEHARSPARRTDGSERAESPHAVTRSYLHGTDDEGLGVDEILANEAKTPRRDAPDEERRPRRLSDGVDDEGSLFDAVAARVAVVLVRDPEARRADHGEGHPGASGAASHREKSIRVQDADGDRSGEDAPHSGRVLLDLVADRDGISLSVRK